MIKQSIITIATLGLLSVTVSAFDTKGCTGCHGADFEKSAMGKSKIVKDMSKADIETALKGYKDGSYGGAMKMIMKGQASKMSDADITTFASSFAKETPAKDANVTDANTTVATPAKDANATDTNTTVVTAPAKDANTTDANTTVVTAPATDANTTDTNTTVVTAPAKDDNTTDANTTVVTAPAKDVNVAACTGCHGANFEKSAMGKSKKVNEMAKADIVTALTGYKDGSYGGAMKMIMKGQALKLSEDDIKAIAEKFGK